MLLISPWANSSLQGVLYVQGKSNKICFIGIISTKGYYKQPSGLIGKYFWEYECLSGTKFAEGGFYGRFRNRDGQLASRSVLEWFTDGAVTISLYPRGISFMASAMLDRAQTLVLVGLLVL